ncbi:hypothetical protein ALC53_04139, partial [Atta colombica]
QTIKMTNVDNKVQIEKEVRKHENMLLIFIRGVIYDPSNCGKTNVLISLLESSHGLRFENVYMYSKLLQQIGYFTFSSNSDVVPPNEALPNSIFVFDDVACYKQDAIRIRDNANLLILLKQDGNLKHVYNDHINIDTSYEDFCELYRCYWQQKYRVVIDKDSVFTNTEKDLMNLR